ncbi:MAG TPA: polysaccharide biosynthesis C-terminal domain-containing protein [Caldilineaceae bacterium]|nr:polysaccharide biosynthesis C-terminal domain-containing protein [Caldilineaceae bacterium]
MWLNKALRAATTLRRTLGDSWAVALGLMAHYLFTALTLIALARRLTPDEYGQYVASVALASFLVALPNYGLDTWLLGRGGDQAGAVAALWRKALALRAALLMAWAAGMALLAIRLPPETYPRPVFAGIVAGTALESLALLTLTALRAMQAHRRVALIQAIWAALALGTALLLPLAPGRLALFTTVRAILAGGVALWLALAMARRPAATGLSLSMGDLLRQGQSFLLSDAAALVYMRADLVLVGLLLGPAGASIYGPALSVLNVALIVPTSLFYTAVPSLAQAFVRDATSPGAHSFGAQARRQLALQTGLGVVIGLGLWGAAPVLVWLYGPAFVATVGVLRLLAPIGLLRSLNYALAAQLIARQRQARRTLTQMAVAVFAVVGNLLVIPEWGVAGAAFIFVAGETLLCLGYFLNNRTY